jgi:hypothetical protein
MSFEKRIFDKTERDIIRKAHQLLESAAVYNTADHDIAIFSHFNKEALGGFQVLALRTHALMQEQGYKISEEIRILADEIKEVGDKGFNDINSLGDAFSKASQKWSATVSTELKNPFTSPKL